MIKVAVRMPAKLVDAGEFLADVRALEAAGAEMIGLDGDGSERWILMGAIAAVTDRIRLWVSDPEPAAILQRLSRGRVVGEPAGETWALRGPRAPRGSASRARACASTAASWSRCNSALHGHLECPEHTRSLEKPRKTGMVE